MIDSLSTEPVPCPNMALGYLQHRVDKAKQFPFVFRSSLYTDGGLCALLNVYTAVKVKRDICSTRARFEYLNADNKTR